jgi:molecular chaperone GrpE
MDPPETGAPDRAIEEEVQRLRSALDEERRRGLRLLADFDTFRRRAGREQEVSRREGQRAALLPLLGVLDAIERALGYGSVDPEFYEGVSATHRLFLGALREAGAEPIDSTGRPFDPSLHEAVATAPAERIEPGIVAREVRRGWRVGGDVLRPAQVVVATAPRGAESWP